MFVFKMRCGTYFVYIDRPEPVVEVEPEVSQVPQESQEPARQSSSIDDKSEEGGKYFLCLVYHKQSCQFFKWMLIVVSQCYGIFLCFAQ